MATAPQPPPFQTALLAGALAGTTVDLSLFPLDTLKTRLQSSAGFFASGGFRGIYRGVGSAVVGSAPGAAFFFCTYEASKSFLASSPTFSPSSSSHGQGGGGGQQALIHMAAASAGEIAACAVRVPTEVVKQRAQAGQHGGSSLRSLQHILGQHRTVGLVGVWRELYRGWGITVMREVPFTILQFPLWEALKGWGRERRVRTGRGLFGDVSVHPHPVQAGGEGGGVVGEVSAAESALYGSISGGVAAAVTTPLDVLKTRVMLSQQRETMANIVRTILRENGVRPFFAGIGPRVMWISAGGAIFLGSYQWAVNALEKSRLVI
ncbi:mitochondrial carrier domain-containing protein [Chaetomium sp. MPI-CAGE-AT-0009]|nr:mitochondrial carrier domain-containing protein [Chaetomium sp. MPI-CAGE-AT-0009]